MDQAIDLGPTPAGPSPLCGIGCSCGQFNDEQQVWWQLVSLFGEDGLEVLDEDTSRHLLAGEHLGRVALSIGALPAIFPVNFVYADGEILFRTAEGAKLTAATAGAVVAFEVDRSDSPDHTGWSVMVVGRSEVVPTDKEHEHPAQGRLAQWASARGDALVRVVPALWTGRRISRNVTAQEPPAFA